LTPTKSIRSYRSKPHPLRGYLFIAAAALCWGISASLGRAAFTGRLTSGGGLAAIDPLILAQSRTTISLLVLAPILLLRRGRAGLQFSRKDLVRALALAIFGVVASNYFYYLAIQRTNVGTAIVLQYTAQVWVLLYMVARGRQRATLLKVGSVALAIVGIALVIGLFRAGGFRMDSLGLIAAELAAFSFAFYNVYAPSLLEHHDRWKVLLYVFLWTALFWMVINPPWKIAAAHYSGEQWLFLAVFAVMSILLPFSFYFAGLQNLDPTRAIVTSCLEPVFSILIAFFALGEIMRPSQILGIALVLSATVLVQLPEKQAAAVVVEPIE
jgi:drug/metabolite transporter (DMT)-like permease